MGRPSRSSERYITLAKAKLDPVRANYRSLAEKQQPIVVWGVGTNTQSLLATTKLKATNIKAFVDSNTRYVGRKSTAFRFNRLTP